MMLCVQRRFVQIVGAQRIAGLGKGVSVVTSNSKSFTHLFHPFVALSPHPHFLRATVLITIPELNIN